MRRQMALFLGHGSPMNAIEENEYSHSWKLLGKEIEKNRPEAIVCFSAHWQTGGFYVTSNENPPVIYDFGGFSPELSRVKYPAPGSKEWATTLAEKADLGQSEQWGLDHGTWSILVHMVKAADIPVLQVSLDRNSSPRGYFDLGRKLRPLRDKGVLFMGSGNLVHNLARADLFDISAREQWAIDFDADIIDALKNNDIDFVLNYGGLDEKARLAINSKEHFKPLLFLMGLKHDDEIPAIFNQGVINRSLSMTSARWG